MNCAICLENIFKSYGPKNQVLSGVNLCLAPGRILGFFGRNGAGKSTTIKIILGLSSFDSGQAKIFGRPSNLAENRESIGFLPESVLLINELNSVETLEYAGKLRGLRGRKLDEKIGELLQMVNLEAFKKKKVGNFSKGMRQRLGLAVALVGEPKLLIADEPQSGLDPEGVMMIRDILKSLRARGQTVFYSTHHLLEAGQICDEIAVLDKGKIVLHREVGEDSLRLEELFKDA